MAPTEDSGDHTVLVSDFGSDQEFAIYSDEGSTADEKKLSTFKRRAMSFFRAGSDWFNWVYLQSTAQLQTLWEQADAAQTHVMTAEDAVSLFDGSRNGDQGDGFNSRPR